MQELTTIQLFAVWALPVLFAITVHEATHGLVAYWLGDKTAKMLGRLSLNPIKHISLLGTIIVPIILLSLGGFMFGWAKPVPVIARNFKKPRRDMALVAVAGPISNLIMLFIWAFLGKLGLILTQHNFAWASAIFYMGQAGIAINAVLAVLNLLPIPPLDGGHVVLGFLPLKLAIKFSRLSQVGFLILLLLLVSGALNYLLNPPVMILQNIAAKIIGM